MSLLQQMKPARLLFVVVGLLVVTVGVGLALLLTPGIQRWALLRAAGNRPGFKLAIGEVAAGFTSIRLRGVELEQHGIRITVPQVDTGYSLRQLIFSRRLVVRHFAASGLLVDASRLSAGSTEAAVAGVPAVAPGVLGRLQLPVELVADDVRVTGRALLRGKAGQAPVEAEFDLTGGGIAPRSEGELILAAKLRNPAGAARVTALSVRAGLRATQTDDRTFSRVGLTAVVDAEGANLSGLNHLKVSAELFKDSGGEKYNCSVDTLLRGVVENILTFAATLPAGGQEYAGQWTFRARAAQVQEFLLGRTTPDFNARGEGRFAFNPATGAISLSGEVDADVSRWEAVEPAWRAIGPVRLQSRFDVAGAGDVVRLRQLEVRLTGDRPVFELSTARAVEFTLKDGRLQVGSADPGEVFNLDVTGLPVAWVRPFVHAADVSGGLITGRLSVSNEEQRLLVRTVTPLRFEALNVVQRGRLLLGKADISLNASATLAVKEIRVEVAEITLKTPEGDSITAQAGVTLPDSSNRAVAVRASYRAELPKLLAPWLPFGIKAVGDADLAWAADKIELRRLSTALSDDGGLTMFKADALRPFVFDLATGRATAGSATGAGADLLRLVLGKIPLDRLPLNQPGARLTGEVQQGEFVLALDGGKMTVRSVSPFKLAGVSLSQDGRPALSGLAIEARPAMEIDGWNSIKMLSGDAIVRAANGATLLTFRGEAGRSPEPGLRASLAFEIEVPALATQPLFAGAHAVTQGRASGEVRAALGGARQVEARMTINGLEAREGGQTLPVANVSFRAVAQPDGRIMVEAPLLLDRAGWRSELKLSLGISPGRGVFGLDGKLTGEQVELADTLAILGVFFATAAPAGDAPERAPTLAQATVVADTVPAWSRFSGRLALDVKSVTRGADWTMTGLTGLLTIEPTRVTLQGLEAAWGEKGRLSATAGIKFTPGARPYGLAGDLSLSEFDAGKFFKALEPDKPATVEGVFSVTGKAAGQGETMDRLLEFTHGRFELTSRQGIFRGLQRTTSKVSMSSKAVELSASVLGSFFGSEKATKAAEKVAGTAYFVDQLAQSVGEFSYDQFNVILVRDERLNMTLEGISLVSPEIRLSGKGMVTYVPGKPLLEQPLSVTLSLAGRGKVEQILAKLRLLDGNRDELGYAKTSQPIAIAGTLAKPDPSAYFIRIAASKLMDFLAPDN